MPVGHGHRRQLILDQILDRLGEIGDHLAVDLLMSTQGVGLTVDHVALSSLRRRDDPAPAQSSSRLRDDRADLVALLAVPLVGVQWEGETRANPHVNSQVLQHSIGPWWPLPGWRLPGHVDGLQEQYPEADVVRPEPTPTKLDRYGLAHSMSTRQSPIQPQARRRRTSAGFYRGPSMTGILICR